MNNEKIFISAALILVLLSSILMNHFLMIPALFDIVGRDAWISVVIAFPALLVWLCILYYIMKKTEQKSITLLIKQRYGNIAYYIIVIPLLAFLLINSYIALKSISSWIAITYLPKTPQMVIEVCLLIICTYCAFAGITSLAVISVFLFPFILFFELFLDGANIQFMHITWMKPMLQNGWNPILKGSFYIAGGYIELLFILLVQHNIKKRVKFWQLLFLGSLILLSSLFPLFYSISLFGPQLSEKMRFPVYEQWRLLGIGQFIQHVDFISVYQFMSCSFIRIALTIYLSIDILNIKSKRNQKNLLWSISFALFVVACIPITNLKLHSFIKNNYFPIFVPVIFFISILLVLFVIKFKVKPKVG
ncbi:GerAB/ArcD/ProY family transporter [Gottfriedia solisilvae]|uniref:Putative spore germination protein YfkT n=1 Tax=Gottfriedia solisilvae TaxID=1516104 RepID=A0A8J3AKL1_9BACI|nr:endospore germination permease [Gottfriedia solisilvae]GGI12677.1 putative spore germination protein YfkT [Gottfriedia solisilvae]